MKVSVKTLKGSAFEIEVNPQDKIGDVKKLIETMQGQTAYPADQQMLIHQGKILKDDTTLEENKVAENNFLVIMLSKTKASSSGASTTSSQAAPTSTATPTPVQPPAPVVQVSEPAAPVTTTPQVAGDPYDQAASNLVAGSNLEQTIQQILEMGDGTWDRDTVMRALRAAFNNPERAIDYLYSGIPEHVQAPPVARPPVSGQPAAAPVQAAAPAQPVVAVPPSGPNANPLNLFPEVLPNAAPAAGVGNLDMFRNNPQFQSLLGLVQAQPQILQPLLQELGKQNPQLLQLIQDNQAEFLQLINQPLDGEGALLGDLAAGMPQAVEVTPEEEESILRLQAMGFDHDLVLEVFIACNRDEQMAANYLLDHMHEFEDDAQQP